MTQHTTPPRQVLRDADDVLKLCHCGDVVVYRWNGDHRTGAVAGWRAIGYGNKRQHALLIFRSEEAHDRPIPVEDVVAKLVL